MTLHRSTIRHNVEVLFKEQIDARKPLSKEGLSLLPNKKTYFGKELKEGDKILNFLYFNGGIFTLEQILEPEIEEIKQCFNLFHKTDPFPTFCNKAGYPPKENI